MNLTQQPRRRGSLMNLAECTFDQRVVKIKEIFRYANRLDIKQKDVAEYFRMDRTACRTLLHGLIYKKEIKKAGCEYRRAHLSTRRNGARNISLAELSMGAAAMHGCMTLQEACQKNRYDPVDEAVPFIWMDEIIKHLWDLRGAKLIMFAETGFTTMPKPRGIRVKGDE